MPVHIRVVLLHIRETNCLHLLLYYTPHVVVRFDCLTGKVDTSPKESWDSHIYLLLTAYLGRQIRPRPDCSQVSIRKSFVYHGSKQNRKRGQAWRFGFFSLSLWKRVGVRAWRGNLLTHPYIYPPLRRRTYRRGSASTDEIFRDRHKSCARCFLISR